MESGWGAAGAGITRRRVAQVLAVFAVFNLGMAALLLAVQYPPAAGATDTSVPDFLAFWAAGRFAVEGTPWLAYDALAHRQLQQAAMGVVFSHWLVWYYPPVFQLFVAPFGGLPLAVGMAAWVLSTLALFLFVCWRVLPDRLTILGALAAAPTLINLVNGQTGFLVAALVGLALLAPDRRPWRAGAALGLLAVKPHAVLALPVVYLLTGRWRVLLGAAVVLALVIALTFPVLGARTWSAFLEHVEAIAGTVGDPQRRWEMHATLHAALRLAGLGAGVALLVHVIPALLALWLTMRAWRSPSIDADLCAALACFATVMVAPRLLNYDLHILTVGVLFQLRHGLRIGLRSWEPMLIGTVLAGLELSVFAPPLFAPLAAPVLFLGCLVGQARSVLPGGASSAVRREGDRAEPERPSAKPLDQG